MLEFARRLGFEIRMRVGLLDPCPGCGQPKSSRWSMCGECYGWGQSERDRARNARAESAA